MRVAHVQARVQLCLGTQRLLPLPTQSLHCEFLACSELLRIKCILNQITLRSHPFL